MKDEDHPPKNQTFRQLSDIKKNEGPLDSPVRNALFEEVRKTFQNALAKAFNLLIHKNGWHIAQDRKAALLEKSGWLPHHTTPFVLIKNEGLEQDKIADLIATYYTQEWTAVEQAFLASLAHCDVDEEAKETMREALAAHRQGLFRVAPRLLFPEIERAYSDAFLGGKRTITKPTKNGKQSRQPITRLGEFWEEVGKQTVADLAASKYSCTVFLKSGKHFYDPVDENEEDREKYRASPVPNRHAALHGIICYKTQQTSLNAIIMTDHVFQILGYLKKYLSECEDFDEAGLPGARQGPGPRSAG